ncbi:hypothetical protein Micbo1qcDRAFT_181046 [Microdochium bolleyi]|uniref:BZIP domain-containing protein n=1 Tax=Microdochium bolleyi TaxID=196109 RepID=A0A136IJP6_9PEZI|nr:hypothetical protein Micbo1qcDRAFT_181046 [Microdochium bolleyi]
MPQDGQPRTIPNDIISGSRQASDKRRRNAAASARFRKRRKAQTETICTERLSLEKELEEVKAQLKSALEENRLLRSMQNGNGDVSHLAQGPSYTSFQGHLSREGARLVWWPYHGQWQEFYSHLAQLNYRLVGMELPDR